MAFRVEARDGQALAAVATYPKDAPERECLIRFGEPVQPGNLPVYRLWMTQATFNTWSSRPKLNNTPLDVTFVLGDRRAIYNADGQYAGSPYISGGYSTPSGNRCGYTIGLPEDDPLFGGTGLVLDWPGGHGNEYTAQQEQMAYWLADQLNLPYCHRYHIRLAVNGVTDMQRGGVFEAINQPGRDFVKAWSPDDSDGDLFKIERGYEFSDGGSLTADPMPRLQNYTTTGGEKKTARYRWNWLKRAYRSAGDFTNLFNLVDAVNSSSPEPYTSSTMAVADIEQWMRLFAFEHIINNFDSWGHEIAKNMFAYKPKRGKWQIYAIDLDWLMLVSPNYNSSRYSNGNGPLFIAEDPAVQRMYNHPPFQRAYYRAVQDAVDGPMLSENCDPVMDAKYNLLVANGINRCDGSSLASPAAVKRWFSDRRRVLLGQLALVASDFSVTATATNGNLVTLTGTAPISVKTLNVNGLAYEPVWTSVTAFTLNVPLLVVGTNRLAISGTDLRGQPVANASATLEVVYAGQDAAPADWIRINEIGAWPAVPGASFVELCNASTQYAFDIGGWRLAGLDYTFPAGTVFLPNRYLVLAQDRDAFLAAHPGVAPDGVFAGNLSMLGEKLALLKPGGAGEPDETVSVVRYDSRSPWPSPYPGVSLQAVDGNQDLRRVANWKTSMSAPWATPGAANSVAAALPAFPEIWLNEAQPENQGAIVDGSGQPEPWVELYNGSGEEMSLDGFFLSDSDSDLSRWAFPVGSRIAAHGFRTVFANGKSQQTTSEEWHTSFQLSPTNGQVLLSRMVQGRGQILDYLDYTALRPGYSYGSLPDGQPISRDVFYFATPGGTNDGSATPLSVRINEWMASNTRTLANPVFGALRRLVRVVQRGGHARRPIGLLSFRGSRRSVWIPHPRGLRHPRGWLPARVGR